MADEFDIDQIRKELDTKQIRTWRSIITLIVFVLTNINVLFPFHIPFYIPRILYDALWDTLTALRIIPPRQRRPDEGNFVRLRFPMNFVTAPLVADLFLLAIQAIGRQEVHDGTIGANNISPIDIMVFFLSLAYIAISIDASGLIRYLAFKVLQWGGDVGHRLFFYLYAFFFALASFIGNDPIILSGTAFLAYMTRVSSNIVHPRAWIYTQFAVANIASAILVSSNPTNLVLAGAFDIKFINYTANIIVPVVVTGIVLFPFLLYIVFADEALIPISIKMHELPEEAKSKKPVNPNIPHARGQLEEEENDSSDDEPGKMLSLEEIMNPFLDKGGAAFGGIIMAVTLITVLALNAASNVIGEHPVFWVTLPAAFVMFMWDLGFGWYHRKETREIARKGRQEVMTARLERAIRRESVTMLGGRGPRDPDAIELQDSTTIRPHSGDSQSRSQSRPRSSRSNHDRVSEEKQATPSTDPTPATHVPEASPTDEKKPLEPPATEKNPLENTPNEKTALETPDHTTNPFPQTPSPTTLKSLLQTTYTWLQETFPTATTVLAHLPFALVPFAFTMFILVQALVTKGWVPVFAYGWDHWVSKTGTVGAIGGMGFLSVILCNFAGTNIGTTILLSRIIQAWQSIHRLPGAAPISDRTFWATVYSMALGVNYGAFSAAFSASLAGLLWRDILMRKHIRVPSLDFARVNLPIIAISMTVGCVVLVGQVYVMRGTGAYDGRE